MREPIRPATLSRLQWAGMVASLVGSLGLLVALAAFGDRWYWIAHDEGSWWITAPQAPARITAVPVLRAEPPVVQYERGFELEAAPERAVLEVRALRDWTLFVNEEAVPVEGRDPKRWKRATAVDVAPWLRAGTNRLRFDVVHAEGPTLLHVRSDDLGRPATTGPGWTLRVGDRRLQAVIADDVRHYPHRDVLPRPAREVARHAPALLAIFLGCALLAFVPARALPAVVRAHPAGVALAAVAAFWLALFVGKGAELPRGLGYDGEGHVAYVEFLAQEGRLPRADDGWEMFHPPLYYGATWLLREAVAPETDSTADRLLFRLLPMLAGLACAFLAGRTARVLFPGRGGLAAIAVLAAGLMPMNVYLSVFSSPESLHAALLGVALWLGCLALGQARAAPSTLVGISLALGGALLAKSTVALPVAGLVIATVFFKQWQVEGRPLGRALGTAAALLAGPLLLSGWFYVRNALLFGDPFVSNLDSHAEWSYWLPPGFHTSAWFLRFGEVLQHPYLACFQSYWDGLYSTFWGDGGGSGRAGIQVPSPFWDYRAMAAIYLLALPATAVFAVGFVACLGESLRGDALGRRLGLSMLAATVFGLFFMLLLLTIRLPYHPMPKAFYALPTVVPLAVMFACGVDAIARRWPGPGVRALLSGSLGGLGVWIAFVFLQ